MVYNGAARRALRMPWKETSAMDQRLQLLGDWLSGEYTKRDLCHIYIVSRPTVDKWIRRYQAHGALGLAELSRAPRCHPNQTATMTTIRRS